MPYVGPRRRGIRGGYPGYRVRGLDGRRWGGPGAMGLVSPRSIQPPLHIARGYRRRGMPYFIEDPMDEYDVLDAVEADGWMDDLDDEEYAYWPYAGMWSNALYD